MNWLYETLWQHTPVQAVVIICLICALGLALGKLRFRGISLGVTYVFFIGILFGALGLQLDAQMLSYAESFGLILFVFSIGMQVGPGFFSSFKKGGIQMNMLAALVVLLNVVVALGIYYAFKDVFDLKIAQIVGILSGAVTNTPGLGAAQQALSTLDPSQAGTAEDLSMGYAAAYPLGVVGIIISMIVLKAIFRVKISPLLH